MLIKIMSDEQPCVPRGIALHGHWAPIK